MKISLETLKIFITVVKEAPLVVVGGTVVGTLIGGYHFWGTYQWEKYRKNEEAKEKENVENENELKLKAEDFEKNKMTQEDVERVAKNYDVDPKKVPKAIAARYIVEEDLQHADRQLRFKTAIAQHEYHERRNACTKLTAYKNKKTEE